MTITRPILQAKAQFGVNYDIGFTGLISRRKDFISAGIDWFTRWNRMPGDPPVSHAFIITGPDSTVEAFANGVKPGTLSAYLQDPDVTLIVKRPLRWNPDIGYALASKAKSLIGKRYNYPLIVALAISNSFLGKGLSAITGGWFGRTVDAMAEDKHALICSQFDAEVMAAEYPETGFTRLAANQVTPQIILSDSECYQGQPVELLP